MKHQFLVMRMRYHKLVGDIYTKLHKWGFVSDEKYKIESDRHFLMVLSLFNEVVVNHFGGA